MFDSFSETEIGIIRGISSKIVDKFAPDERPYFSDAFEDYFVQAKISGVNDLQTLADNELGFDGGQIEQSLLTGPVISAVIFGVLEIIKVIISQRKVEKKEDPGTVPGKEEFISVIGQGEQISLNDLNISGIRRVLFDLLRRYGIGAKRAEEIVDEFIVLVIQDLNIVAKKTN